MNRKLENSQSNAFLRNNRYQLKKRWKSTVVE